MEEERTPLRPLGVGEILDVAINIVLKNWRTLIKTVLVVVVPVQLLSIAVLASTIPDADLITNQSAFTGDTTSLDTTDVDWWRFIGGYAVVFILGFFLTALATAACFKAVSDAYLGAKPDWRESLRFARAHFHSVLWVTFLVGVGVMFGTIALIIPGIWLFVAWSTAVAALLFEGEKGTKALGRSFGLVKGHWWRTFGVLLVGLIIAGVAGGILSGLVSALAFTDVGDSVLGAAVLNGISTGVGQLVATPVQVAIVAVIYYDLRVRKEGLDLETLIERLGVRPAEGNLPRAAQPATGWQTPGGPPPTAPGWQQYPPAPSHWEGPPPTAGGYGQAPLPPQQWQGPAPPQPQSPPLGPQPQQTPRPDKPASLWQGPPQHEQPPAPPSEGGGWAPPRPPGTPDRNEEESAE